MTTGDISVNIHDLPVTLWVGKAGVESVTEELASQLEDREYVKVKVLRSARHETTIDAVASRLAQQVDGTIVDVRGHTVVLTS